MRPTIANSNILRFRNELRPEGVANVAGLLEPIVSQVKNSLNEATRVSPSGSNVVETPEYYRNLPSTNIPVGDFLVGNADRALLDVSQHRPPDPYDVVDLGLLGLDAFFPARGAVKLTSKALTSPFAKDIYANVPNAVNRLNQRFTGVDLQPSIFIGEKSPMFDKLGGDSKKFLENEGKLSKKENWEQTGTFRGIDGELRQEVDDSTAKLRFDEMELNKPYLVKDVYDHPTFAQVAPNVNENTKVVKVRGDGFEGGSYNPRTNTIEINENIFKNKELIESLKDFDAEHNNFGTRTLNSPDAVFNHELTHAVQHDMGFDVGSNYGRAGSLPKHLMMGLEETLEGGAKKFTEEKAEYAGKIRSILEDVVNPIKERSSDLLEQEASLENMLYKGKSGELEARTSQFRRELSPEERRAYYPLRGNRAVDKLYASHAVDPESVRLNAFENDALGVTYGIDMPRSMIYETKTLNDLKHLAGQTDADVPDFSYGKKIKSISDELLDNNKSMSKVYPLDPEIKSYRDIPNKDWLEHKRDRARLRGFGDVGSHIGSAITGGFQDNVVVPTKVLKEIQGLNLEQQNVRPDSLEYLKDYMSKNKHLPKWYSGYDIYKTGYHGGVGRNLPLGIEGVREDVPFIQVDQYGQPFVNEGNHRIMTANKLGWENLPIELRYFEGGNIESGLLNPDLIKEYNRTGNPNIFDDELQKYIEKVKTNKLIADYYLKKLGKK